MFQGQIPTGQGNSRLAALQARKRPTIDVNNMGIAVEAGGGQTPMLTNRVESLSDRGLAGVSQRGFSSGRDAIGQALEASGRTYRTGLINQDLERAREQKEMDYALAAEDEMAKAKSGAAVEALQARNKADTEAEIYFSPSVSKMREDNTATKMDLYDRQTAGTRAQAQAAIRRAELESQAAAEGHRLDAGSKALTTFDEIRAGLQPETPAEEGIFFDTPAVENDQPRIDQLDELTMELIKSLGLDGSGSRRSRNPNAVRGAASAGADPGAVVAGGRAGPAGVAAEDQRTQAIGEFARRHGLDPEVAEGILVNRGIIPGAQ